MGRMIQFEHDTDFDIWSVHVHNESLLFELGTMYVPEPVKSRQIKRGGFTSDQIAYTCEVLMSVPEELLDAALDVVALGVSLELTSVELPT